MTVQELIDELSEIEDKTVDVCYDYNNRITCVHYQTDNIVKDGEEKLLEWYELT